MSAPCQTEWLVFLPCNHPSRVKLHTWSTRSHDTVAPFRLDTCTMFGPLLTATPWSLWNVLVTALLQLAFTCKTNILFHFKKHEHECWCLNLCCSSNRVFHMGKASFLTWGNMVVFFQGVIWKIWPLFWFITSMVQYVRSGHLYTVYDCSYC